MTSNSCRILSNGCEDMFKNKAPNGRLNISGIRVAELRMAMQKRVSQRELADRLQLLGVDLGKNAIQQIESGERFVTDIELKALAEVLGVTPNDLLGLDAK